MLADPLRAQPLQPSGGSTPDPAELAAGCSAWAPRRTDPADRRRGSILEGGAGSREVQEAVSGIVCVTARQTVASRFCHGALVELRPAQLPAPDLEIGDAHGSQRTSSIIGHAGFAAWTRRDRHGKTAVRNRRRGPRMLLRGVRESARCSAAKWQRQPGRGQGAARRAPRVRGRTAAPRSTACSAAVAIVADGAGGRPGKRAPEAARWFGTRAPTPPEQRARAFARVARRARAAHRRRRFAAPRRRR